MEWSEPDEDIQEELKDLLDKTKPTKEVPPEKPSKKDTEEKEDPFESGVDTPEEIPEGDTNYGL